MGGVEVIGMGRVDRRGLTDCRDASVNLNVDLLFTL